MMKDFSKLLSHYSSGDHVALLEEANKRKTSANQEVIPTPADSAIQDIGEVVQTVAGGQSGEQQAKSATTFGQPPPMQIGGTQTAISTPMPNGITQTEQGDDTVGKPPKDDLISQPLSPLQQAQQEFKDASVIKPASRVQDFAYGALQGLNKALNGGNEPIRSWGELGRNKRVAALSPKLAMLEQEEKQKQIATENQSQAALRNAQAEELAGRPAAKLALDAQKQKNALERINRNADIKAGIAKPVINEDGNIELEYLNAGADGTHRQNELLKGADGLPVNVPGEQGVQWKDPLTGVVTVLKAKQTAMPDATAASGNANRADTAARTNAENGYKAQKDYIDNVIKIQTANNTLLANALTAEGGVGDDPGIRKQMDGIYEEIASLGAAPYTVDDPAKTDTAIQNREKRIQELTDKYNTLNTQLIDKIEKGEAGKQRATELRKLLQPIPKMAKYTPYQATQVGGGNTGKPVPKGKDPLGIFQ